MEFNQTFDVATGRELSHYATTELGETVGRCVAPRLYEDAALLLKRTLRGVEEVAS